MTNLRIWKDCPWCEGTGFCCLMTEEGPFPLPASNPDSRPCPLCANHYADLDKAVAEEIERCANIVTDCLYIGNLESVKLATTIRCGIKSPLCNHDYRYKGRSCADGERLIYKCSSCGHRVIVRDES